MPAEVTSEEVYQALKTVYDPEIPVNVVDLGLIYDVQVTDDSNVFVQMTLTFPGCGMGPHIAQQAEWAIQDLDGVEEVEIELTFDPALVSRNDQRGSADDARYLAVRAANSAHQGAPTPPSVTAHVERNYGHAPGKRPAGTDQAQLAAAKTNHRGGSPLSRPR